MIVRVRVPFESIDKSGLVMISQLTMCLYGAICSLCIVLVLVPFLNQYADDIGWVDIPNRRKRHKGDVPLTGGLAILIAVATVLATFGFSHAQIIGFELGAGLIFATGFYDDRQPIGAGYRIGVHLTAAFAVTLIDGTSLTELGDLFGIGPIALGILAVPFTIVGITGVTNAINLTDGADGLAAGLSLIALFWLMCALLMIDQSQRALRIEELMLVTASLMGAIIGFLHFNLRAPWRRRAKIFMGDGGSMLLGFCIAWLAIHITGGFGERGMTPVAALWILTIPLFDTVSCIIRRLAARQNPMAADRMHLHHLLLALGLPVGRAVFLLHLASLILGGIGIWCWYKKVPEYWMFWTWLALFILYLAAVTELWEQTVSGLLRNARLTVSPASMDLGTRS